MHPIADLMRPAAGEPCWLTWHGYGSFVTMEFGEPQVEIRRPILMPVSIEGHPSDRCGVSPSSAATGTCGIYCCRWSLTLEGRQFAHEESDDITMDRALAVLNGQILTYPAPAGTYNNEPVEQWRWYRRSGQVAAVRGDGTYALSQRNTTREDKQWRPITTTIRVSATT